MARDPERARSLLENEAPDDPVVHYFRGVLLDSDVWGPPDRGAAFRAFEKAAKGELGRMTYHGPGLPPNRSKGRRMLEEAAKAGDRNAKRHLKSLASAPAPAQGSAAAKASRSVRKEVDRLSRGKPFKLTENNLPLLAGMADGLVRASRSAKTGRDGGDPVFIRTCAPVFDKSRCRCLAQIGRSAIPAIHQRRYSRELVHDIIKRNPMLGFAIGGVCRIVNC